MWPLRSILLIAHTQLIYNTGYKIGYLVNPSSLLSGRTSYVEAPLSVCRLLTVFCVVFVRLDRETTPNYTTEEGGGGRKEGRKGGELLGDRHGFLCPSLLAHCSPLRRRFP